MNYRVGTRKSRLSLTQTKQAVEELRERTSEEFEIVDRKTLGDTEKWKSIDEMDEVGVFTRELDRALIEGEIDLAVHSTKDVPTDLPDEIEVGAILKRERPNDALIGCKLEELGSGMTVGTGSPRREAQLLNHAENVEVVSIRGNVETRLEKVGKEVDAVVLASVGLKRLGLEEKIDEILPIDEFLPAPGQASLTVTCREEDEEVLELLNNIDHRRSRTEVMAEKAVLKEIGKGCSVPLGTYAETVDGKIKLTAEQAKEGERVVLRADTEEAEKLGSEAAKKLKQRTGEI